MASVPMVDLGFGPYLHEARSSRFPVYTRGNAGEVWPEVAYPLSMSLTRSVEDPLLDTMIDTGMVTAADVVEGSSVFGGCYGGYMYLNLSFNRVMAVRSPGVTIEENDATYFGSSGLAPPHRSHPDDKNWRATLGTVKLIIDILRTTDVPELRADQAFVRSERRGVEQALRGTDAELVAELRRRMPDVMRLFSRHIDISARAGAAVQVFSGICEKQLGDRSLALTLIGGLGDVDSAAPSSALWQLGRLVAADPALTALFDRGISGLEARLAAAPDAAGFNDEFAKFLDRFGSRGPNEWETACDTWGTRPELALALVDRMRGADERQAPAARAAELAETRRRETDAARRRLPRLSRGIFERSLRAAGLYSAARERSKTTVVDLIQQARVLSRELAGRVSARVPGGTWEDMWFCLEHELDGWIADPAAFVDTIAARRATRDELARRVPPFVFDGEIPPADTWELRVQADDSAPLSAGESLSGLPAVTGVAEGRARIVTDPFAPGDLGPGDVLVAPLTDPAWTPLFIPAEAVVVDVGGQMSHAVIVAREFGMPCVVAATGATSRIPDGARVRVDGTAGTVTILD